MPPLTGILDALTGGLGLNLGGLVQPQAAGISGLPGFRSYVRVPNGDAAYDTAAEVLALITGTAHPDFYKIWQQTVGAQETRRWGFGSAALQANQGFMWFASLDAGTDWDIGVLRLVEAKSKERISWTVAEIPDPSLHTTTVTTLITATPINREEMIPLPEKTEFPQVGEDSLLQLWYALETAATTHDVMGFQIPITIRN